MTIEEAKKRFTKMSHREWLSKIGKEEALFRMYEMMNVKLNCSGCKYYHRDSNGIFMCYDHDHETFCREEYEQWLDAEMEE